MKLEPRTCSVATCETAALTLSDPALCAKHIDDLDDWYHNLFQAIRVSESDESLRYLYTSLAHSEYMAALSENPIDDELYKDFVRRAAKPKALAFSIDHFITALAEFYITCAVSGILGNFSYAAVKATVLKVLDLLHKKPKRNEDNFDEIVNRESMKKFANDFT